MNSKYFKRGGALGATTPKHHAPCKQQLGKDRVSKHRIKPLNFITIVLKHGDYWFLLMIFTDFSLFLPTKSAKFFDILCGSMQILKKLSNLPKEKCSQKSKVYKIS